MQPQQDPRARRDSLEPTEARQANNKKTNLRVLLASMVLAVVVGAVLVSAFWRETPPRVDASSGGNPSQNTEQPASTGAGSGEPSPSGAPEAAPTSPPTQNQTNP